MTTPSSNTYGLQIHSRERTSLAWIRTALGFLAGGIVVGQFYAPPSNTRPHDILGVIFALRAAATSVGAFRRWRSTQAAMRRDDHRRHRTPRPIIRTRYTNARDPTPPVFAEFRTSAGTLAIASTVTVAMPGKHARQSGHNATIIIEFLAARTSTRNSLACKRLWT